MTDTTFKVPEMHCGHCKPANHRSRSGPRRPPTATRLNNELLPLVNVLEKETSPEIARRIAGVTLTEI
jgi:hypothetical protein